VAQLESAKKKTRKTDFEKFIWGCYICITSLRNLYYKTT